MLKWIRTKILKGIIKDILQEIPSLKDKAINYFERHQDEILEQVLQAAKKAVLSFVQKRF